VAEREGVGRAVVDQTEDDRRHAGLATAPEDHLPDRPIGEEPLAVVARAVECEDVRRDQVLDEPGVRGVLHRHGHDRQDERQLRRQAGDDHGRAEDEQEREERAQREQRPT
jgi:hypothetical protein